jgi:hypothetical protein
MGIVNGMGKYVAHLTIVPVLMVGATRLENVPFWVLPDAQLDWCPGILGIDVLLKLETLRWDAGGAAEIGFPAERKDIRNANLCFWRLDVFAAVPPVSRTSYPPIVSRHSTHIHGTLSARVAISRT